MKFRSQLSLRSHLYQYHECGASLCHTAAEFSGKYELPTCLACFSRALLRVQEVSRKQDQACSRPALNTSALLGRHEPQTRHACPYLMLARLSLLLQLHDQVHVMADVSAHSGRPVHSIFLESSPLSCQHSAHDCGHWSACVPFSERVVYEDFTWVERIC